MQTDFLLQLVQGLTLEWLDQSQDRAARVITAADYRMPTSDILSTLGWSSLKEKRNKQKALMVFKVMNGMTPAYLKDIFTRNIRRSVYKKVSMGLTEI